VPDWFAQLSAFGVFLAIGAVGFVFLLVSLVFGEVFDHFDFGVDHDVDHGAPGIFSTRVLAVFITAFGCFGAVSVNYGLSPAGASAVGTASGVVFGSLIYAFARFLYGQQATTQVSASDLVGQSARVVVRIPEGGVGQVRCRVGEELVDKIARTADGAAVPENAVVTVQEILGETVVVRRA
jgi:membrane protein implicated in regulation of membrane protease activity